jgi:hypothetical protein
MARRPIGDLVNVCRLQQGTLVLHPERLKASRLMQEALERIGRVRSHFWAFRAA